MSQEFWIPKGGGNPNAGDMAYDNTSRVEAKRSHQWFMDGPDTDLLPNKKQALELPSSNSFLELLNSNPSQWGVTSSFQTAPGNFDEQLFDPESARMMNYDERGIPTIGSEKINLGRKVDENLLANDSPFALSMSHISEDPGSGMNYSAARKVKVNQVKGSEHIIPASIGYGYNKMESNHLFLPHPFVKNEENPISLSLPSGLGAGDDSIMSLGNTHATENSGLSMGRPCGIEDESASIGQTFAEDGDSMSIGHLMAKERNNIMSMGQGYQSDVCSLSVNHMYNKEGCSNPVSVGNSYDKSNIMSHGFGKGQSTIISFGGCNDDNNSSGRLIYNYEMLMGQSSLQMPDAIGNMGLIRSDSDAQVILSGAGGNSKKKEEQTMNKKSPSNNFPSNVRSLLSTGILDGVHVKYIAWSREKELRGIIRGCGYLCGCLSCNYTKVINAYEFERHAGCKTKHPNNHIYFENGKTIYGTVQELRSTPQHMLFEVMQTITGSPINQKSFHLWKESYLAATQELQRIYGKDDGKLLQ